MTAVHAWRLLWVLMIAAFSLTLLSRCAQFNPPGDPADLHWIVTPATYAPPGPFLCPGTETPPCSTV